MISVKSGLAGSADPVVGRVRLAILTTHPIQYYAPWFREIAMWFELDVLYAHRQDARGQNSAGFGVDFDWDIPLLEGYHYRWLKNVSPRPGLQTFSGCDTPELSSLIHPRNYDVLLVLGWHRKALWQGLRAAWRNGVPVLSRGDSQLATPRSLLLRILKRLPYRWFLRRIDGHLYVGTRNRQYLEHYAVRQERLFFSPHFVNTHFFSEGATKARSSGAVAKLRSELLIPANAAVALFVGKLIPKKRPADFVRAARFAMRRRPSLYALIVGNGPLCAELKNMVSAEQTQTRFVGFRNQTELPAFYASADMLVLPSDAGETWGLVVNEAMACGTPAIVSDAIGCAPDLIIEGETGLTFPCRNVPALGDRLVASGAPNLSALQQKTKTYSIESATQSLIFAAHKVLSRRVRHPAREFLARYLNSCK